MLAAVIVVGLLAVAGRVEVAFGAVWQAMDRAAAAPNPIFDAQRRVYESLGVTVVPVPMFPTGEGGLHCLVLQ